MSRKMSVLHESRKCPGRFDPALPPSSLFHASSRRIPLAFSELLLHIGAVQRGGSRVDIFGSTRLRFQAWFAGFLLLLASVSASAVQVQLANSPDNDLALTLAAVQS